MREFYDHNVFGVRRLGATNKGKSLVSEICLPGGKSTAMLAVDVMETKFQLMKVLNLKASFPVKAEILGANDRVIVSIDKPFSMSEYLVNMQDSTRRTIATVRRATTETGIDRGTYDYTITDADQAVIGIVRGNWRKGNLLQIIDERGGVMGKISRTDPAMGMGSVMDLKFHVVNCYAPPEAANRRLAVMSTAAAIDFLVD